MTFEWDEDKAAANLEKHGLPFEEAATVFNDPFYIVFADPDHSSEEFRYLIFGNSKQNRLVVVSYTERGNVTRLISARLATSRERNQYEEEV